MTALAIQSFGAITAAGPNAARTMGAIHARIQLFGDTKVDGPAGDPITGALTPLRPRTGRLERVAGLGVLALMDCAAGASPSPLPLPVFVCAADEPDLGSPAGDLLEAILAGAPFPVDRARSRILARGKDALPEALTLIGRSLVAREAAGCYLVGVDNLIAPKRLRRLARAGAVVDGINSDGFVPGEGAAALLLAAHADKATKAIIAGVGAARDPGLAKGDAATGQAIGQALEQALADARLKPAQLSAAVHDLSGQYALFEELALAAARPPLASLPALKMIQPAIATGELGAASGVLSLAAAAFFLERGVAREAAAALFTSAGPARGAAILVRVKR
jgi:3-oxoacyl-[acyl-carrier-protein] synthase-1